MLGAIEALRVLIEAVPYLGILFSAVIGLIPGCAPLVMLLSLFGEGVISTAAMLAGLLTSTGTGLIVLYKTNSQLKRNVAITLFILLVGIITGGFFELTDLLTILGI